MTQFPKKYNYKNTKIQRNKNQNHQKIYTRLFSSDQKLHPWSLFSIFLQDYYSQINSWFLNDLDSNIGFWLSSKRYSKLNDKKINLKQIQLDLKKQLKQNKKFIDKIGFSDFYDQKSFVFSEDFNLFVRQVFQDLYKNNKIFCQKEVISRSKNFQTNVFKNNIKIEKKDSKEFVLKYFIESKWVTILVSTKNIETIFADVAVAVNPQDKRYKKLIWQNVIIPIINKSIPIIWEESVDSFAWTWVVRITPWHDEYWLEIAQKHKLPIDVFAIDTDWNFTNNTWEFSNKSVEEFLENVIKYIDDIWNLESTNSVLDDFLFDNKTDEQLYKITLDQWNVKYDYSIDYLIRQIEENKISISPIERVSNIWSYLSDLKFINISNKSLKWILIPILESNKGEKYPITQDILLERYNLSKSKKDITLTLIILNLILDNQINESFDLEEIINVLFDFDFANQNTKLSKYIEIYQDHKNSDFKKWLKDLKKFLWKINDDVEKIKLFWEILENSFAIKKDWEDFYLDFSDLFDSKDKLFLQRNDSFNKEFLDSLWFLYQSEFWFSRLDYSNIKQLKNIFMWTIDETEFSVNSLLLSLEYSKVLIFSDLFFYPNLVDQKWNKINNYNSKFLTKELSETLDTYWSDLIRLLFLTWEKINGNILYDTYKINESNSLLNKIWNANRYVYNNYAKTKKHIKINNLIGDIKWDITDYDSWILHGLKSLVEDVKYQLKEKKIMDISKKILNFVSNDLCDKYIESIKLYNNQDTNSVALFSFIVSLKLLKPYLPFFVNEIESIFGINLWSYNILDFNNFDLKEKNYKINILMDIVDKLRQIKTNISMKKHEAIDVFIQANPEFISFLSENENLFRSLLSLWNIDYIRLHEDIPIWYEIDNVININIWAKKVLEQVEVAKDVLSEMEEDFLNKKEHLQHLKSLVVSIIWSAPVDILNRKRQEIQNLQSEIEDLEFSINKLKAKN